MESTATVTGGHDEAATEIKSSSSSLEGSTDCSTKMEAPKMLAGGAKEAVEAAGPAEADEKQEEALQDRYQEKENSRDENSPAAQEAPEAPAGSGEVKMSKGKVALIMLALCVSYTVFLCWFIYIYSKPSCSSDYLLYSWPRFLRLST